MTESEIVRWVVVGVEFLLDVAGKLGHRDAALIAADGVLKAAREKTDQDLEAKHRGDPA